MAYTMLTKDYCPWCDKAAKLLNDKEVHFITVELSSQTQGQAAMLTLAKMAGFTTVPQVFTHDGTHIGGYEDLVKHLGSN